MKLFNKTFFYSPFILTVLVSLSTTNIEGMEHQSKQMVDESTQTTEQFMITAKPINPHLKPLKDLCDKYNATKYTDIESLQKAFSNIFDLICTSVVRQNNPSQSIIWLESLADGKELDQLVEKLEKPITHDASITVMAASYPGSVSNYESNYYVRMLGVIKIEVEQLYKKMAMLALMLNIIATTGQRPKYFDDTQLLQKEVISQIANKEWQDMWEPWQNRWKALQGVWATVSGSCVIL
jgi:hypothetical protein